MHVLFLHTSTEMCRDGELWYYDEGLAIVAGALQDAGHSLSFRTIPEGCSVDELLGWIESNRTEDTLLVFLTSVHLSAYGHDGPDDPEALSEVRRRSGLRSVFIGNYATMNPAELLKQVGVDAVGRGEMFEALPALCDAFDSGRDARSTDGFWFRDGERTVKNPIRPAIADLDRVPLPRRDLLPVERMANEREGILTVVASHGCPHDCSFCVHPVVRALLPSEGSYVRWKSTERVLREIREGVRVLDGIRAIFFHDDIFASSKAWARDFLPRYAREIGLPFGCNLTVQRATPELARQLASAGCVQVQLGVESGSERVRQEVVERGLQNAEIEAAVRAFQDAGVAVKLFAMTGVPGETSRDVRESIRAFARFGSDMVQVQLWKGLTGSKLLAKDADGGRLWRDYQTNEPSRRVRRTRVLYGHFHRAIASYRALSTLQRTRPASARFLRGLLNLSLRYPLTARCVARALPASWLSRLAPGFLRDCARDVRQMETLLASVHLPARKDAPPVRIDARCALAEALPAKG